MPDPRWTALRGEADSLAPGLAPAFGRFLSAPRRRSSTLHEPGEEVAGCACWAQLRPLAPRYRNAKNGSVYVDQLGRRGRIAGQVPRRMPVAGEIAAGQYNVTVAYHDYPRV